MTLPVFELSTMTAISTIKAEVKDARKLGLIHPAYAATLTLEANRLEKSLRHAIEAERGRSQELVPAGAPETSTPPPLSSEQGTRAL